MFVFLLTRHTAADRRTGQEAYEAIGLKAKFCHCFSLRHFHPKAFAGFCVNGVNKICSFRVVRIYLY